MDEGVEMKVKLRWEWVCRAWLRLVAVFEMSQWERIGRSAINQRDAEVGCREPDDIGSVTTSLSDIMMWT